MNTRFINFEGLDAVEITTANTRMVVITEMGPRIAFFGRLNDKNLFYWVNDDLGREGWLLKGGHRVWVARPGADESEDAYASDNEPCQVDIDQYEVCVTGKVHPFFQTSRGIRVRVLDDQVFEVNSFLKNCGPMLYSGAVWAPTCTNPQDKKYIIPLGDRKESWDIIKLVIPRSFGGHTSAVNDNQITFTEDFLVLDPQGLETKRMIMAPFGMIGFTCEKENLSFIKSAPYHANRNYPLGCNLAFYVGPNNFMVEMETYSEEQTILPGNTVTHTEIWRLLNETLKPDDPENYRKFIIN
jgi:hypothetical protein